MSTDLRLLCVRGASPSEVATRVEALLAGGRAPTDGLDGPLALAIVVRDGDDLRKTLASALPSVREGRAIHDARRGVFFEPAPKGREGLAFLCPGQGSQSTGMLLSLRGVVPGFGDRLAALDAGDAASGARLACADSLLPLIDRPRTDTTDDELRDTRRAQPAIGLVSLAIARTLLELGARPRFTAGHSYGELTALAIAGAWDDATFMRASRARGAILAEAGGDTPGAMAAVFAPRAVVETLLTEAGGLVIANDNAPEQCVVSGESDAITRLEGLAGARGVRAIRLRTACAFHSPKMAPAVARFRALLEELPVSAPQLAAFANVTAAPHGDDPRVIRELLAAQIVEPVRWVESVEAMYAAGARVFLETGPGRVLTGLVKEILGARPHLALAVDPGSRAPAEHLAHVVAALVAAGVPLDAARIVAPPSAVLTERAIVAAAAAVAAVPADTRPAPTARGAAPSVPPISTVRPRDAAESRFVQTTGHVVARYFEQQASLVALCADAPAAERRAVVEQALAANERIITAFLEGRGLEGRGIDASRAAEAAATEPPRASPTTTAAPADPPGSEGWIRARIAELTGFPLETIRGDSDIESDLGLDSLTRTELYCAMVDAIPGVDAQKAAFRACRTVSDVVVLIASIARAPQAQAHGGLREEIVERVRAATGRSAEEITAARDLAEIGLDAFTFEEVIAALVAAHPELAVAGRELAHARTIEQLVGLATRVLGGEPERRAPGDAPLDRLVRTEIAAEATSPAQLPRRVVVIGGVDDDRVAALLAEVEARGARAESIGLDDSGFVCSSIRIPREDVVALGHAFGDADAPGVIFLAGAGGDWDGAVERSATALFVVAKALAKQRGAAWLAVIGDGSPAAAGARGVARALAREWPAVRVRAVQIDGAFDARRALEAVAGGRTELDLVLRGERLLCGRVSSSPLSGAGAKLQLARDGVVVLVGGGDGIGAEIAVGIARRFGVSIATVGRTALPAEEPFPHARDELALQRALLAAIRAEGVDPRREGELLRARARRVARERALVGLRRRVSAEGASFQHEVADATVRDELARALDAIRAAGKPIVGVVHAVGATEDALLGAKSVDSFRRVLHSKARSIEHLRRLSKDDPLAFALVFSSLAAHTGTAGQTDYVAANEIVGAAAAAWNAEVGYPVRAILWAVWSETGLASAALKRQMTRLGLPGIGNAAGVAAALAEIERGEKREPWVLISPRATLEFAASPQQATRLGGGRA